MSDVAEPTEADNFKYDVAFSFCNQDEPLAQALHDLLVDRHSVFLYSKRQTELAGRDGEEVFNVAFGSQSRVVVVLYRKEWGTTPWTRIEETAIRNRAHEEGYDFSLFIPLDDPPEVPRWLPKTRIWCNLSRFGQSGTAAVISSLIQTQGGTSRSETIDDRSERLKREMQGEAKRRDFLDSTEGTQAAQDATIAISDRIEAWGLQQQGGPLPITHKRFRSAVILLYQGFAGTGPVGLSFQWHSPVVNDLKPARLKAILWDGHPPFPGVIQFGEPKQRKTRQYLCDYESGRGLVWIEAGKVGPSLATNELADELIKFFIDEVQRKNTMVRK